MRLEEKFLVLKIEDIRNALTDYERVIFARMVASVGAYREYHGMKEHEYVVINQDEPYFPDVLKLMEEAQVERADNEASEEATTVEAQPTPHLATD